MMPRPDFARAGELGAHALVFEPAIIGIVKLVGHRADARCMPQSVFEVVPNWLRDGAGVRVRIHALKFVPARDVQLDDDRRIDLRDKISRVKAVVPRVCVDIVDIEQ
jgi:hypothetical protein